MIPFIQNSKKYLPIDSCQKSRPVGYLWRRCEGREGQGQGNGKVKEETFRGDIFWPLLFMSVSVYQNLSDDTFQICTIYCIPIISQ